MKLKGPGARQKFVIGKNTLPDLTSEIELGLFHSKTIIGVDEVGRGCLAGSVVAAAALLPADVISLLGFNVDGTRPSGTSSHPIHKVRDSKLIPEPERAPLAETVKAFVAGYGIGEASVEEIESLNILYASHLAMERAVAELEAKLGRRAEVLLIDGNIVPRVFLGRGHPLIKGDLRCLSIACASIIAKVYRDEMMATLDARYPGYGLREHKGYSTPFHKKQLSVLGATEIHRKSFRGVLPENAGQEQGSLFPQKDNFSTLKSSSLIK